MSQPRKPHLKLHHHSCQILQRQRYALAVPTLRTLTQFGGSRILTQPPSMKQPGPKNSRPHYGLMPMAFVCGGMWVTAALVLLLGWLGLRMLG